MLFGVPSLAAFLYFFWALLGLRSPSIAAPAGAKSSYSSLVEILVNVAQLAGKALQLLTGVARWAVLLLCMLSVLGLIVAIALFAVGRGLHAHQNWARVLGILIASVSLLAGASGAVMLRHGSAVAAACTIATVSLYVVWALWREFV